MDDEVYMESDGIALGGEELEDYCQKHGLCNLCAETKTHKRVFRLKKKNQWQPLTVESPADGGYIVYKGYCVQAGCFTLDQAKRLLGEIGGDSDDEEGVPKEVVEVSSGEGGAPAKKKGFSRLLGGKGKKKGMSAAASGAGPSFDSMAGMSGISTYANKRGKKTSKKGKDSSSSSSRSGSTRSVTSRSSEVRRDDDDVSVAASAMTSASTVRRTLLELLKDNAGTILDLSSTRLHHNHVTEMVNSLNVANSLQTLILENCKLNDNEIEVIGTGLGSAAMVAPIQRLSLRSNRMGNRGAVSLQAWLLKSSTLLELDLSKNQIGSRGATSTLHALRDNPKCCVKMINFAHNEIWDPDDGSFFASNTSLELLNLEGNFIHDEGIEAIAKGIRSNRQCSLQQLYLGWNGIGDEGCIQLAKMLETNKSILKMGLGENDITSTGARSLLSSLASNSSLREITGLYHNQIDRKFVIAAIKRLLHSHVERLDGQDIRAVDEDNIFEASLSALDTLAEPLGSELPPPEEMSENSLDWEEKLYTPGQNSNDPKELQGVPLGNFDHKMGDHGEDCTCDACVKVRRKAASEQETAPQRAPVRQPIPVSDGPAVVSAKAGPTFKIMPKPATDFDRLTVIQSAPLAYFNRETSLHVPLPLQDYDYETHVLTNSVKEAEKLGCELQLEVLPGHHDLVRKFFDVGPSRVLHLSCFGHPDHLAFENDYGYIETMSNDELRNLVKASNAGGTPLKLVVVNSFHSGRIGKAFVEAGVPHVVCCHHTEIFRDRASAGFCKNLYRALASNKSLKEAFHMAQEAIRVEEISKQVDRFVLLPRVPQDDPYHDVQIFYTDAVPPIGLKEDDEEEEGAVPKNIIPHLPKHFIGREVDVYEILEALKVDDVVRVGGCKGSGRAALAAAVCRYIDQRKKIFKYDDVFWVPALNGVVPEPDTLFSDLCGLMERISTGSVDLLEDEKAMEFQANIEIALEERRTIIAVDERKFENELAAQNLENFLTELLNNQEVDVKLILVTPASGGSSDTEEEDTILLKPIDFHSTALLFGEVSRFITPNGCPAAQSPDEFAALMVPPSVAKLQDQNKFSSSRRTQLMRAMGNGVPGDVIRAGKTMKAGDFIHLIGLANTPEVRVDSYQTLEKGITRWTQQRDTAVKAENYLRAADLENVLEELKSLRRSFPSLEDLVKQEQELQRKLTSAMSRKEYGKGNTIKREILALKKVIMQEKRAAPSNDDRDAQDKLADLQKQMTAMMKLANNSFSDMDNLGPAEVSVASFSLGSAYHHCEVAIYPGNAVHFNPGNDLGAIICWTNECCDTGIDECGKEVVEFGGPNLAKDISSLPGITKTPWGMAKCGTGNAVIVGPGNYDDLIVHCVILAVGPLSPSCTDSFAVDDEDSLHYVKIMMRSCIRSALILAKHSQVQSVAFPTLTTKLGSPTYEQTLLLGLKILVEEAKHSDLNNLHIIAKNEEEASKLIALAIEMGLVMEAKVGG